MPRYSRTPCIRINLFLEEKTPAIEDFTSVLTPELNHIELHDFATQIANGMAHLESMSIIHRYTHKINKLTNRQNNCFQRFGG